MGAKRPPSCCGHEGEESAYVDQSRSTSKVCITDYDMPALKCGALV